MKTQSGGLLRWDIKSEKIDGGGGRSSKEKRGEKRGLCKAEEK